VVVDGLAGYARGLDDEVDAGGIDAAGIDQMFGGTSESGVRAVSDIRRMIVLSAMGRW